MAKDIDIKVKVSTEGSDQIQSTADALDQLAQSANSAGQATSNAAPNLKGAGQALESTATGARAAATATNEAATSINNAGGSFKSAASSADSLGKGMTNLPRPLNSVRDATRGLSGEMNKAGAQGGVLSGVVDKIGGAFSSLPGPLGQVASSLGGVLKNAGALIASPLGAVIGGLTVAFSAMASQIKKSDAIMDQLDITFGVFDSIVQKSVSGTFSVIGALLRGLNANLIAFGEAIGANSLTVAKLIERLDDLNEAEAELQVTRAQSNASLAEAKEIMGDQNETLETRRKKIDEVRKAEDELAAKELENAKLLLEVQIAREALDKISGVKNMENIQARQKAQIAYYNKLQELSAKQRQLNRLDRQLDKEEEQKQKEAAKAAQERANEAIKIKEESIARKKKLEDEAYLATIVDAEKRAQEEMRLQHEQQDRELQARIDQLNKIKRKTKEELAALSALKAEQAQLDIEQEAKFAELLRKQKEEREQKVKQEKKEETPEQRYQKEIDALTDFYKQKRLIEMSSEDVTNESLEKQHQRKRELDQLEIQELEDKIAKTQEYTKKYTDLALTTADLDLELYEKRKAQKEQEAKWEEEAFQTKVKNLQAVLALTETTFTSIDELRKVDQQNAINAIEARYEKEFTAAEGNDELMQELEDKKLAELNETRKKQFEDNKKLQYATALINGAQAVASIIAQYPKFDGGIAMTAALIAAGVTITAQLLKIKNTQFVPEYGSHSSKGSGQKGKAMFADGGIISGPGTGTSDSIAARLSNGEAVINARSTEMFSGLLSLINQAGGGRPFADGGMNSPGQVQMPVLKTYVVASEMTSQQEADFRIQQVARL